MSTVQLGETVIFAGISKTHSIKKIQFRVQSEKDTCWKS